MSSAKSKISQPEDLINEKDHMITTMQDSINNKTDEARYKEPTSENTDHNYHKTESLNKPNTQEVEKLKQKQEKDHSNKTTNKDQKITSTINIPTNIIGRIIRKNGYTMLKGCKIITM